MRQKQPPTERLRFTCGQLHTASHKQLQPAKLREAPDGVYEGVGCARQQSEVARNDSRGVFVYSKFRPRSTKSSQNRRTISFHAREPSALATSPMKKRLSPKVCCAPGDILSIHGTYPNTCGREHYVPVRACTSLGPKKGKKTLDSCSFASIFLNLRNTNPGCKPLTLFSSHMYMLPKHLRASA